MTVYHVIINTGNENDGGTSANVFIQLFGSKNHSDEVQLVPGPFDKGTSRHFDIDPKVDLGSICAVKIRHDNAHHKPGWYLGSIEVDDKAAGRMWQFTCNGWLATDEKPGFIYRVLWPDAYT